MKLLLDMGVAARTADFLIGLGRDAVHLRSRGLARLSDPDAVRLAEAEGRIIVTFDLDYARIIALQRLAKPSVVLFRLDRFVTDDVNRLLASLLQQQESELLAGAILVADPARTRLRMRPIW